MIKQMEVIDENSNRVCMTQDLGKNGVELRADDRRSVEERQDAGAVHRAPVSRTGRGGQVLPGERGRVWRIGYGHH